ncbi:MAG: LppU/SCO3897 family protein, partial [Solimonas sp.]
ANAVVGDCLAGSIDQLDADTIKVVECSSDTATFRIVGRVSGKTEAEAEATCEPFPETEFFFWHGEWGRAGTVLCLTADVVT